MIEELREVFWTAFKHFAASETDNILNGTSERNLCARLATTLEQTALKAGFDGYWADPEYNRKQRGQVKTILDDELQVVAITPDIILHSRGRVVENDNLIAIEMKRIAHRRAEKDKDRLRLRALTKASFDGVWSYDGETHPEHVCGYKLGYYIELDADARQFLIEEYRNGDQADQMHVGF